MESLRKVRSFMPVTVKCYGWRCMPGSMLSAMSTHAFLGIDSEQEHCKTRVFVLTRRLTREGPSDLFFLSLSPRLSPYQITPLARFFFRFIARIIVHKRCFSLRLFLSLLSTLYRLLLFAVSIYANSSTAKKHGETSFPYLIWSISFPFRTPFHETMKFT